ncbi:HEAT repeat domain-containing protein [Geomonas agri]|uniref:HEAT repeat domain-containing protein n=1 Tax=Geomonas agri TaxID=2873702 RepID=UPI001CD3AE88|nr:HEAT repeat domain-containing protein [Geomonas agri]
MRELNVSRRNMAAYPPGHQIIDASLASALTSYAEFLGEHDEIIVGVAGSTLVLADQVVDKSNPVMRDFARTLHERGIGTLVLKRGLSKEELRRFIIILGSKREKIHAAGGVGAVWEKSGITSLAIREIRYDLFIATEEPQPQAGEVASQALDLWERFALVLKSGLKAGDVLAGGALDPELVAEALNCQFGQGGLLGDFTRLLGDAFARGETAAPRTKEVIGRSFAGFVAKLNPVLRQQFLAAAWLSEAITAPEMESLIRHMPLNVVRDTLKEIGERQQSIPPFVLQLLRQLSSSAPPSGESLQPVLPEAELSARVETILKEHASEEFIPQSYQDKLHKMMDPGQVPLLGSEGVRDLLVTLEQSCLEKSTGELLLLFLKSGVGEGEEIDGYARNLYDIGIYFLREGDYPQFIKILREVTGGEVPIEVRQRVMELLACDEFVSEVLDGLETWGKPRFDEIAEVIATVGAPFSDALLEGLAQSESMSLRRFMMDRLVEIGTPAAPSVIARLSDSRWYFLRNLITLVRRMKLSDTVERLRVLARHSDRRVAQEALRALLEFGDTMAEGKLVRDLESDNQQAVLAALEVAGMAGSARVLGILHAMLLAPGFSTKELQVKRQVVQALGEVGNPESLPLLEKLFASVNLLYRSRLTKLKLDAVMTLWRYPADAALPLLKKIAAKRGAVGRQAASMLRGRVDGTS